MSVASGTATSYLDLMMKFRDFITTDSALVTAGQEWECIAGKDTGTPVVNDYMSFKGQGLGGADEIYFSVQAISAPVNNYYNLCFYGHVGYDLSSPGVVQTGGHIGTVSLLLANANIAYWFVANGRRAIIITRLSGRYDVAYLGLVLPDHLPNDWSYPMFVGASSFHTTGGGATLDTDFHSNFWDGTADTSDYLQNCTGHLYAPGAAWRAVATKYGTTEVMRQRGAMTLPWSTYSRSQNVRRTVDDVAWLERGQIAAIGNGAGPSAGGTPEAPGYDGGQWYGSFDGVFYTSAFGAAAEQIVTEGSVDYMLVPNIARTGDGRWAAIAME